MFKIQSSNPNYLARIVKLGEPRKHSNADKLFCHTVLFNNIITDMSYKAGDLVVYFPLESQLNKEFVAYFNGFQKKELNIDQQVKGFFDNNARVRAVKLRGEPSMGFIIKLEILIAWLNIALPISIRLNIKDFTDQENVDFDSWGNLIICNKYEIPVKNSGIQNPSKKKIKRESKIVEGQFRVSEDTQALKRNIDKIQPDDIITISYKMHGTNSAIGRVLCKRKLSIIEKVAKFFGSKINESFYDLVYASRTVIKNAYADKVNGSYYKEDVWEIQANKYKDFIQDGITLYSEIVGQLPSGGPIQKKFDYGFPPGQSELFVYRITYTKSNGDIIEFTTPQIQRYCNKFGLKTVPIFYYGKAKNYIGKNGGYPSTDLHWHENFLQLLIDDFTEKNCYMCKNSVPEEGVVITKESDFFEAYKLKSFKFLKRETELLDQGEGEIEEAIPEN